MSSLNASGLSFILIMGILTLLLPRRLAFMPIIITGCYITLGQQLLISGLHFSAMRLVILFAWIRLIVRGELFALKLNSVDKAIICWVISNFVIYNLQWQTSDAFVNRLGFVYNTIGIYIYFRFQIRDLDDIETILRSISIVIIPLAIAMLYEYSTGKNIFSLFGGVPENTIIRGDRFRCQGPFRHPILSGTFGATLVPVLLVLWFKEGYFRRFAVSGVVAATVITITSASSGPLMAYIFGVVGLFMWSLRHYMRAIRWGLLLTLVSLHLVMKAPGWYLITRISDIFGGGGWHRSYLIDQAVAHIGEWWLLGVRHTGAWFPYSLEIDPLNADITNQYIVEGLSGGLLTMILFIVVIIVSFRTIGLSLKKMESNLFAEKIIVWSLGASLFAHVVSFISVPYFDQIIISWYLLLSMIAAIGDSLLIQSDRSLVENAGKEQLQNYNAFS